MQAAILNDSQFLDASTLTTAFGQSRTTMLSHDSLMHFPGVINNSSLVLSYSGMTATLATAGAAFLYSTGAQCIGAGTTDGANTSTYTANFASLVPGSGTVVAYLVAAPVTIQQGPFQVVGPPQGHPDYDASFAPYTAYAYRLDSVNIYATTTAPDNATILELGRTTLSAGQSTLPALDISHRPFASSLLNPLVTLGTYTNVNSISVGADGRITGLVSGTNWVQNGTGVGQLGNQVKLGWTSSSKIRATVDATDIDNLAMEGWVNTQILTETNARVAADNAEATARANADSTEATNRSNGDAAEATARNNADTAIYTYVQTYYLPLTGGQLGTSGAPAGNLAIGGNLYTQNFGAGYGTNFFYGNTKLYGGSFCANQFLVAVSDGNLNPNGNAATGIALTPGVVNVYNQSGNTPIAAGLTGTGNIVNFFVSGGLVGGIYTNGSGVSYSSVSDYRIKSNVADADAEGIHDKILAVKVREFNIRDSEERQVGFIAHELAEVFPDVVNGEKDGVKTHKNAVVDNGQVFAENVDKKDFLADKEKEQGNLYPAESTWKETYDVEVLQSVSDSKLVPYILISLQNALKEIRALQEEVAALKETR